MLLRSMLTALCFLVLGVVPAAAQSLPSGKDLSKTASGLYSLDKTHASLLFKISHLGFSMYHGRFNVLDAKLNFDAKVPDKSIIDVTVDTNSIDTNNTELQSELKGEKWFNTAKFSTATFKSTHISRNGDNGTMIGDLNMLGVTRPVTLNVTFHGAGIGPYSKKDTVGFSASGSINRSQWGMSNYVPMVGDEVHIDIEAEFNYDGGTAVAIPAPTVKK
jgi:polyisoprenoid-binding protein YceI